MVVVDGHGRLGHGSEEEGSQHEPEGNARWNLRREKSHRMLRALPHLEARRDGNLEPGQS